MGIGITEPLAFAAVCIWLSGFLITQRQLGVPAAMVVTSLKVGLTLIYFSYLFTGDLLMKDDRVYHEYSIAMFDRGWGPLRMMTEPDGFKEISVLVGSGHFLYYWWNLLAFTIFGKFYYAPVFLNVGLTFASGALVGKLARMAGFSRHYERAFMIFFLLHWDLITWSSFVNLKDMIVLFLTISSMYCFASLGRQDRRLSAKGVLGYYLLIGLIFFLFGMLRYYLPILVMGGVALWSLVELRRRGLRNLMPVIGLIVLCIGPVIVMKFVGPAAHESASAGEDLGSYFQPTLPLYPAIRFFLMPQFWTLQADESFLFVSAFMHWMLFIPLIFGAISLWKYSPTTRLLLCYSMVTILFYSMVTELQGYRHRMQLTFIISWCQFQAIWSFLGISSAVHAARERGARA